MPSAHTILRELVAHLGRAQRAFDAGRLDEADRALDEAFALDPRNVQAADLRHRIAGERDRSHSRTGRGAPARRPPIRAPGDAPSGVVSPEAWSSFEQRIRDRRADRAVADAQSAMLRGDREAVVLAIAELEAVSPGDSRRAGIEAWLGPSPSQPTVAGADAAWPPGDATDVGSARHSVDVSPESRTVAGQTALERDAAADPAVTGALAPTRVSRPVHPRGPRSRLAIGASLVAASALIGLWMYHDVGPSDPVAPPVEYTARPISPPVPTAEAPQDDGGGLTPMPSSPSAEAAAADHVEADVIVPTPASRTVIQPEESPTRMADLRVPATGPEAPETSGTVGTGGSDGATTELAPPLEAVVQAPLASPGAMRPDQPQVAARAMTPVPVPPVSAPAPAVPATPSPGGVPSPAITDAGAVREVVNGYADAFSALDANATQRVWPGADLRGLRRAFDQLSNQRITFSRCEVDAQGDVAQAVCTGRQEWVPKVGDRSPRSETRRWRFALGRDGGDWVIDSVEVQR